MEDSQPFSDPVSCPPGGGCELCLLLAPNPSSTEVTISLQGVDEFEQKTGKKLEEGILYIYDLQGNLRKSGKILDKSTLSLSELPAGQYVVYYQNGRIITQKNLKIEK
ncbi:T9SS type A sorting domain-containing protein [Algoriphagus confluentis]|uniref:T9SS type A sorting domain-containing protein n=1 Tax=Algoriphagus confluentis TaxID=1697556 RepID=UPI0030C6CCA1